MDRNLKKYLHDILESINTIDSFIAQKSREYNVFVNDVMFHSAVERKIEIIGEAMNRILKIDPNIPISNAKKIVGTRNYVIHGYDSLESHILWAIVINDLPILKREVSGLLNIEELSS